MHWGERGAIKFKADLQIQTNFNTPPS